MHHVIRNVIGDLVLAMYHVMHHVMRDMIDHIMQIWGPNLCNLVYRSIAQV
jgi:hypothetical protein